VKLAECVEVYIDMKHDNGHPYVTSGARLRAFARKMGDVSLTEVKSHHVLEFIEIPETSLATRRYKYGLLRNFFLYCKGRYPLGNISMPPMPPPALPNSSPPHVYSRAEIRTLLRATAETQNQPRCVIPAQTYRTFLLFLYGTGVLISEAYQLLLKDVDLKRRKVTIRRRAFGRIRIIPIGFDLYRILSSYIGFRNRQKNAKADHLFIDKNGRPLQAQTVQNVFQRIRRIAVSVLQILRSPRECMTSEIRSWSIGSVRGARKE
jgi:integrase/recombinase XerD